MQSQNPSTDKARQFQILVNLFLITMLLLSIPAIAQIMWLRLVILPVNMLVIFIYLRWQVKNRAWLQAYFRRPEQSKSILRPGVTMPEVVFGIILLLFLVSFVLLTFYNLFNYGEPPRYLRWQNTSGVLALALIIGHLIYTVVKWYSKQVGKGNAW